MASLKKRGLEEETLRKYMKNVKVYYKFLKVSLHQSRHKWELHIEGEKSYRPIICELGKLSCSFSSSAVVITRKRRSEKNLSLSFSL